MSKNINLARRTRVRLEFTAYPSVSGHRVMPDKKIITLRIMLAERFGEPGVQAYQDWLEFLAATQIEADDSSDGQTGGPDEAA